RRSASHGRSTLQHVRLRAKPAAALGIFTAQEADVKLSFVGVVLAATVTLAATDALAQWPSAGADLSNSRYQSKQSDISAKTVSKLQLKWTVTTAGDVTAHPAVDGNYIYFPDSAGFLYKVQKASGALVWKRPISDYTGITGDVARGTPAVAGNLLI